MKRVVLKGMSLINFRGHKSLKADFTGTTTISGDNRLGKSTIFDAFIWLLFGKDQFDRKDFEIIPIVENKRLDRVDPEVSALVDYDGREMSIKRVLHQKWVRRKGTSEEVFDGCETQYFINDVPLKAGEYKARIDLMIEETIFKLITNPSVFLNLNWTKQREFLFQIAGTVSDHQIASQNPNFAALLDMVNGKSLADFKKEISARKKKLKEELEQIQPRIDQTTRLKPEPKDFESIEKEIAEIDEQLKDIEQQMTDRAAAIRGQYNDIQDKQKQISGLRTKQNELVDAAKTKATQEAFDKNQKRTEIENDLNTAKRSSVDIQGEIDQLEAAIKKGENLATEKQNELDGLRKEWETINSSEYIAKSGCLVCPVFGTDCSDPQATAKHSEAQETAKQLFFDTREKNLDVNEEKGKAASEELKKINERISQRKEELSAAKDKLKNSNSTVDNLTKQLFETPIEHAKLVIPDQIQEWLKLENDIKDIQATITEVKPVDNSDIIPKKSELTKRRDELKKDLNSRDLITQYDEEIKKLEEKGSDVSQQIADLEKTEFTIDAFNKVKIDECEKRINGMFQIVKFQLFDKTNEGNEFECCIPTNKAGIPIAVTNTAERINAGLDIINVLSKFYNVSAPIFCDGGESVNNYLNTGSQMVFLKVTREPALTISNL